MFIEFSKSILIFILLLYRFGNRSSESSDSCSTGRQLFCDPFVFLAFPLSFLLELMLSLLQFRVLVLSLLPGDSSTH